MSALPHDSHFMGILLAEMAALSTCHPEQNPALAGQNIYADKEIVDKQILRLIGAQISTTLPDCLHFHNLQICMNRHSGRLPFHDRQPYRDSCTAHGSGTACQAHNQCPPEHTLHEQRFHRARSGCCSCRIPQARGRQWRR